MCFLQPAEWHQVCQLFVWQKVTMQNTPQNTGQSFNIKKRCEKILPVNVEEVTGVWRDATHHQGIAVSLQLE